MNQWLTLRLSSGAVTLLPGLAFIGLAGTAAMFVAFILVPRG